ncbi:alpha/beta fold hydrolase [Jatrophihabitans sp. YIM 134969]
MPEVTAHSGLLSKVQVHVEDPGGPGRPVVLIHGWPLSGASWSEQIGPLRDAGLRPITYDRRGFGRSDKPNKGYDYDTLADDLAAVLDELELQDVSLVGFSMGGGEVARYLARHGAGRIRSVVFAAAVPPYLAKTDDNPDGPLDQAAADEMENGLKSDRDAFFPEFVRNFYSVNGELEATPQQVDEAVALAQQSDQDAAIGCMEAFATTDFRDDLTTVTVPTLVIHGDSDAVVPFEGSGRRTHEAVAGSELVVVRDAPHGFNVTHAAQFNEALVAFLQK